MRLCVGVDTDSESVERDVACSRQLCPLAGLQLGFDDWLSGRHVLARHAVRNTDSHRALLSAQSMHATYTYVYIAVALIASYLLCFVTRTANDYFRLLSVQ